MAESLTDANASTQNAPSCDGITNPLHCVRVVVEWSHMAPSVRGMDSCELCGFVFSSVDRSTVSARGRAAAESIGAELRHSDDIAGIRPAEGRWSNTEYGAHVRDVFLVLRDRLVIGMMEDEPSFSSLYRDERIELGLYAADTPNQIAVELEAAAAMFGRLFDAIEPGMLDRVVQYGSPNPQQRSLLWMGRQAVHESEHHLTDIRENIANIYRSG